MTATQALAQAPAPTAPTSVEQLLELASRVFERDGTGKDYTAGELMLAWAGAAGARDSSLHPRLEEAMSQEGSPFVADKHQRGVWRLRLDRQGALVVRGAGGLQRALRREAQQSQEHARTHLMEVLSPTGSCP